MTRQYLAGLSVWYCLGAVGCSKSATYKGRTTTTTTIIIMILHLRLFVVRALVLVFVQEGRKDNRLCGVGCSVVKERCVPASAIHPQSVLA